MGSGRPRRHRGTVEFDHHRRPRPR
jgi:hypothetical protein